MANNNAITTKRCKLCGLEKQSDQFGPHKQTRDRLNTTCKPCERARVKAYMESRGDEYKSKKKAYDAARVARLRDQLNEQARLRYEANREYRIAKSKEWHIANPDKTRAIKQNHKHKRRTIEKDGISYSVLESWKASQEKKCHWCGVECSIGFVVDHYFPLSKGGKHELSNLVISCRTCNARKSAKLPDVFAQEIRVRLQSAKQSTPAERIVFTV